jgi:hypothetical protein
MMRVAADMIAFTTECLDNMIYNYPMGALKRASEMTVISR